MKTCSYCHRPQYDGFYKTENGIIYCSECYIREKEKLNNKKNSDFEKYQQELKEYTLLKERINDIFNKRKEEENRESKSPDTRLIKQLEEEEYQLKKECDIRFGKYGPRLKPAEMINAKYFESEEAEEKDELRKKEELKKKEEELKKKEEEINQKEKKKESVSKKRKTPTQNTRANSRQRNYISCPACGRKIHPRSILCDYCHAIVNDYRDLGIEPLDLGAPYKKAISEAEEQAKRAKRTFLIATAIVPFAAGLFGASFFPLAIICLVIWAILGFKVLACNMNVDKANRNFLNYAKKNAEIFQEDENKNTKQKGRSTK